MVKYFVACGVLILAGVYPLFSEGVERTNLYMAAIVIMIAYETFYKEKKGGNND